MASFLKWFYVGLAIIIVLVGIGIIFPPLLTYVANNVADALAPVSNAITGAGQAVGIIPKPPVEPVQLTFAVKGFDTGGFSPSSITINTTIGQIPVSYSSYYPQFKDNLPVAIVQEIFVAPKAAPGSDPLETYYPFANVTYGPPSTAPFQPVMPIWYSNSTGTIYFGRWMYVSAIYGPAYIWANITIQPGQTVTLGNIGLTGEPFDVYVRLANGTVLYVAHVNPLYNPNRNQPYAEIQVTYPDGYKWTSSQFLVVG